MTELDEAQRDIYAPPGTMLRRALDDGFVPWPTLEEAQREGHLLDVLDTGLTTLADGSVVSVEWEKP